MVVDIAEVALVLHGKARELGARAHQPRKHVTLGRDDFPQAHDPALHPEDVLQEIGLGG